MASRVRVEVAPTDAELVRAARGGDVASLGALLERYRVPLHAAALGMLAHGKAEDAVQETFVVALRRIDDVRDPDSVGSWLHAVLRNVCLMTLRRERALVLTEERGRVAYGDWISDPDASVEEVIDRLALRDWVWTALSTLPAPIQATAMLRWFGSAPSYAEIAATLGVPLGTVRSRLSEAKRRLAEALLESSGLAHDQARRARDRVALYGGASGDRVSWESYMRTFTEDVIAVCTGRWEMRGRRPVIAAVTAEAEAGVVLHLTRVLASERVTVLEGHFETVADDRHHWSHTTSQVHFHRADGLTDRVLLHSAPRPREEQ